MIVNLLRTGTLVKRNQNPFSTHIPVLVGLSLISKWNNILEFGSGVLSTPLLANKKIFEHATHVTSYENDINWFHQVREVVMTNPTVSLRYVEGGMSSAVNPGEVAESDLIFIDDSAVCAQRVQTIRQVVKYKPKCVLIHDFEVFRYRFAARRMPNTHVFKAFIPNTGLLWVGDRINRHLVARIDDLIRKHSTNISPNDISGWLKLLSAEVSV
jgi:hypothetical protein